METHEQDPTTDQTPDPWTTFHEAFDGLKTRLRDTYEKASGEDGPSSEELREAVGTLAGVWDQLADSVSAALKDPEVRGKLRDAATSLATAVGSTISDLGAELREERSSTDEEE